MAGAPRRPIVGGNWKCNPESVEAVNALVGAFNGSADVLGRVDVVVFPSAIHVGSVKVGLEDAFAVGAQNVARTGAGAFTGEMTAEMARDMGCTWTLVGHSERRHLFGETIEHTKEKVARAQAAGLGVVLCIGELLEEREAGKTIEVCEAQLNDVLPTVTDWSRFVIAYEPVWAIGTGVVATKDQAQEAHQAIREFVKAKCGDAVGDQVRIQYGGSVSEANCGALMAQEDIDGFLVGGASLKPGFMRIVTTAAGE